jgi:hypothetical protein
MQSVQKRVPLAKDFVKATDLPKLLTEKYSKWEIGTDQNRWNS